LSSDSESPSMFGKRAAISHPFFEYYSPGPNRF
jgi:hypothetical protein